jgi:hypothetical protein
MPLPKIDVATYELTLPSNNKKITYRPFLVKEEKILLMAAESKDTAHILNSLNQIIKNCVLDKIDVDTLPAFDAEYIFIKLRERSLGEIIKVSILDEEANKRFEADVDLTKVKFIKSDKHTNKIKLSDKLMIELKYPTLKTILSIDSKKSDAENGIKIVIDSIDKIYDSETVYNVKEYTKQELQEFVDSLTQGMYNKLNQFFETMPSFVYDEEVVSPYTKNKIKVKLESFIDFFV